MSMSNTSNLHEIYAFEKSRGCERLLPKICRQFSEVDRHCGLSNHEYQYEYEFVCQYKVGRWDSLYRIYTKTFRPNSPRLGSSCHQGSNNLSMVCSLVDRLSSFFTSSFYLDMCCMHSQPDARCHAYQESHSGAAMHPGVLDSPIPEINPDLSPSHLSKTEV
jgi:hypothetical protein